MTIEQRIAELPPMPNLWTEDCEVTEYHRLSAVANISRLSLLTEAVRAYLEAVDAYRGAYPKLDLSDEEAEWQEAEADLRAVVKVMP